MSFYKQARIKNQSGVWEDAQPKQTKQSTLPKIPHYLDTLRFHICVDSSLLTDAVDALLFSLKTVSELEKWKAAQNTRNPPIDTQGKALEGEGASVRSREGG